MAESALVYASEGKVIGEIPDAEAVLHDYEVQKPAGWPPPALFVRDYRKLHEPRAGETYRCALLPGGHWVCTCPDFVFRNRRNRGGGRLPGSCCKHIDHAKCLKILIDKL